MKNYVIEPEYFDTPDEFLYASNCVYRITTKDGHFKIGYTTEYFPDRLKKYFTPNNREELVQLLKKDKRIKVEILFHADNEDMLKVVEQLFIHKQIKQILKDNGFEVGNFIGNDGFKYDCVKSFDKFLNKKLDKLSMLKKYYAGCYDEFFKIFPFDDTLE